MKRAKKRKFREPMPMYFFPARFVFANLGRNNAADYRGPIICSELGKIEGFRIIETKVK